MPTNTPTLASSVSHWFSLSISTDRLSPGLSSKVIETTKYRAAALGHQLPIFAAYAEINAVSHALLVRVSAD